MDNKGLIKNFGIFVLNSVIFLLVIVLGIYAIDTASTNFNQSVIVSGGGHTNISNDTYKQGITVGGVIGQTASGSFENNLGFFFGSITGSVPGIALNYPLNDTFWSRNNITLNATITDPDNNPVDIWIWAANTTEALDIGNHSLVKVEKDVTGTSSGYEITYNFTSPIVQPDNTTVLLLHFDNRSQFGETTEGSSNLTLDFSKYQNNGAIFGANWTESGKFGGAFRFDENDYIVVDTADSLTNMSPMTVSLWAYAEDWGVQSQGHLISKGDIDFSGRGWMIQHRNFNSRMEFRAHHEATDLEVSVDNVVELNKWIHWTFTWNGSNQSAGVQIYKNGEQLTLTSATDGEGSYISDSTIDLTIGNLDLGSPDRSWNGSIDEVAIWNRTLSPQEIQKLYKASGKYYWKVNVSDASGLSNESETWEFTLDSEKPRINSSINDSFPKRYEVINLTANITDNYELNFCQFITNETGSFVYINKSVGKSFEQCSQNFTVGVPKDNVINYTIIAYDLVNNTNRTEFLLTVNNTPPPTVLLREPLDHNFTINRTPTFSWYNVTDIDNDTVFFEIKIFCDQCSSDNRARNVSTLNFTPYHDLFFLGDDDFFYNWTVTAYDNNTAGETTPGNGSVARNITINSYVSLSLITDTVDFGTLAVGDREDTIDETPAPFELENDGNVNVNVSIYANQSMWSSESLPTDTFQYKIDNTTELPSFNWSESYSNWTNFTLTENESISTLHYEDLNDTAYVDLLVEVPTAEPGGDKAVKIVFVAELV